MMSVYAKNETVACVSRPHAETLVGATALSSGRAAEPAGESLIFPVAAMDRNDVR
jgi:hypothetical protein